ncbi:MULTISPECIES: hypothetical protein [unclassified Lactobacillus]|uniref:hypothetical protein n=1 Tax=unclassified Lactobacillus TaxID=2620435 RepID=UPI000EFA7FC2|nr:MULTISPECIES: hypothetical protein [unclassified Lactobacillus]RMC42355.1 hypothetical protein F5ESL0237_00140 [Lactobacillus sp. ESL0237]RMC45690.1 hypothetical protein F5ESL0234_00140 [Lactobacillus sp. ESL0234]RMC47151.1 hypothetical protein F5ESL0236_00140 [Lactobacillus sp. ESL0236]RMC52157.1 hypothetical protein F5ESL0225_00105 [Lactobacillus sp. ESL0225]
MVNKIEDKDGRVYKKVASESNRSRTLELVIGGIGLVVSLISLCSAFGLAGFADAFGGGGSYTAELTFGIVLSVIAFILLFFINKKRILIGILVLILGLILLFSCGNFGIIGGIIFAVDGIIVMCRK